MFLEPYICITFFFISLGLVSLVSFSKRMESPDSVLFNFIQIPNQHHRVVNFCLKLLSK